MNSTILEVSLGGSPSVSYEEPEPAPSCWQRCVRRIRGPCTRSTTIAMQQLIPTPEVPQRSFYERACGIVTKIHGLVGSTVFTVAAAAGFVVSHILSYNPGVVASSMALGYFVQTMASAVNKKTTSTRIKTASNCLMRVQQHTSLATMMLTGFYSDRVWAMPVTCILAGMMARVKIMSDRKWVSLPTPETASRYTKYVLGGLAALSGISCVAGVSALYSAGLDERPRLLSLPVLAAEYGMKGFAGIFGFLFSEWLIAHKTTGWGMLALRALSMVESGGIGLGTYYHRILKKNMQAFAMMVPIGFLLGTYVSKIRYLNALEDRICQESRQESRHESIPPSRCSRAAVLSHAIAASCFWGPGIYFLLKGTAETMGLDVFFLLTPAIYAITRFAFAKQGNDSLCRRIGHLCLHKATPIMSAELNYWLTFRGIGINKTEQNARILYVFQSLLFGSIEGSLFTMDAQQDQDAHQVFGNVDDRRKITRWVRAETVRSYARFDLLMIMLANAFGNR